MYPKIIAYGTACSKVCIVKLAEGKTVGKSSAAALYGAAAG